MSNEGQVMRLASDGVWRGAGGRTAFPGFVEFDFGDVFEGTVVPYDPEWEVGGAGRFPVGSRIPRANCQRVDVDTFAPEAGQEYSGLDIRCRKFEPATVSNGAFWMHDCYITPSFTSVQRPLAAKAMVQGHNLNLGGALFEWVTIGGPPSSSSNWQNCLDGGNYLLRYCALSRGVDALHWNTVGNGRAHGCRMQHGVYGSWWNNGTNAPRTTDFVDADGVAWAIGEVNEGHSDGATHPDGIQTAGWSGWEAIGCHVGGARADNLNPTGLDPTDVTENNRIKAYDADASFVTSAAIMNMDGVHKLDLLMQYCRLVDGAASLNLPWRSDDNGDGVEIKDTLIVPNGHGYQVYKQTATGSAAQTLTNVLRSDTRAPASVQPY